MGFFSWVGGLVSKAVNTVKSVAKAVVNTGKKDVNTVVEAVKHPIDTAKKVWAGAKKIWDQVTGNEAKKIVEEAKKRFDDCYKKYEKKKNSYENSKTQITADVTTVIENINKNKKYIMGTLFPQMKQILSKIKYSKIFAMEYASISTFTFTEIKDKGELISIDFEKNPIKSRLKAILTLGFYANKQARESADKLDEQVMAMKDDMGRMDTDLRRWKLVEDAVRLTDKYIREMITIYEIILLKAEGCANMLRLKSLQFAHVIDEEYCKLEALPTADKNLLFALFNLTKVLDTVVKTQLTSETEQEVKQYNNTIHKQIKAFELIQTEAA